jgi:hypothetical protein
MILRKVLQLEDVTLAIYVEVALTFQIKGVSDRRRPLLEAHF